LADTQDLGSCAFGCEGSSPSFGTKLSLLARSRFVGAVVVAIRNGAKRARFARGAGCSGGLDPSELETDGLRCQRQRLIGTRHLG
jgi:hypothetical protein